MKSHGLFTQELYRYLNARHPNLGKKFNDATAYEIVKLSRMGINPEGVALPGEGEQLTTVRPAPILPPDDPIVPVENAFRFGAASEKELVGVDPTLVRVTRLALRYTSQDFCVYDGIRSYKEQEQHVRNGTSKTMESKHLRGLAVDLVPWINGKPVWDWDGCYKIALAMDKAATELGVANRIRWGGAWDRQLSDFGGDSAAYRKEVELYRARHPGKDFIDGPHFEIRS